MVSAPTLNTTFYTNKDKIIEVTVEDAVDAVVDLSGASSEEIYYIMQKSKTDSADHVYKSLTSGIAFKTDGTDGVIQITIDAADLAGLRAAAAAADLTYYQAVSVELSGDAVIIGEGTATIKFGGGQVIDIDVDLTAELQSATDVTAGIFQSDNNLTAPAAAESASDSDAGVLTVTTL